MTATIKYDRTVSNLIDELSATGHVTHRSYKKTSVTLHHNAGRLSHLGVLNVWKTRPASAHFDVDSAGAVAQYVKVNEYAWAAGNTTGNQTSIHIEMANAKLAPTWEVSETTWKGAARLAGWLFAHVVEGKPRPTKSNFFYHSHWSATACAGPFMDKIYAKVLAEAQKAYDSFKDKPLPSSPRPSTPAKKTVEQLAKEVIAGKWGNGPTRVRKLIGAGYNAKAVQDKVDELLNPPKGAKSIKTVVAEVFAGKWGNEPQRSKDLREAGYDPRAIQAEVNRQAKGRR